MELQTPTQGRVKKRGRNKPSVCPSTTRLLRLTSCFLSSHILHSTWSKFTGMKETQLLPQNLTGAQHTVLIGQEGTAMSGSPEYPDPRSWDVLSTPSLYFCWESASLANISNVFKEKHFKCSDETNTDLWPKCFYKCFLSLGGANHLGRKTVVMCYRNGCLGEKNPHVTKCSQDVTSQMHLLNLVLALPLAKEWSCYDQTI